jgi:hypothetical protein
LYLEKRVSYRRLRKEFGLDDETIEDVRHELIVKRLAVDEDGQGLTFVGADLFETGTAPPRQLHRSPRRSPCRRFRPRLSRVLAAAPSLTLPRLRGRRGWGPTPSAAS